MLKSFKFSDKKMEVSILIFAKNSSQIPPLFVRNVTFIDAVCHY